MNRTGGATGSLFVSDTEPPGWEDGDLWSDTLLNEVKVNVGGTATLVTMLDENTLVDLNGIEINIQAFL